MGEKPIITESAREIICSELKLPFVHSIILIGSRARGEGYAGSDYDLYVVAPISALPFVFPVLKKKEKLLREKLRADVSVSPLTYSRMKRGRDTLLFHTKKEGVILCGRDIKPRIRIKSLLELPEDELFQYFFDSLFYLIKPLNISSQNINSEELVRASAKTIIYCANLRLMINGIYSGSWKKVMELSNDSLVTRAYKIIRRKSRAKDPLYFWFLARKYALETLQFILHKRDGKKVESLDEFSKFYISSFNKMGFFKTLQVLFLSVIRLHTIDPFLIYKIMVKRIPIDKYLHILLLYMIVSIAPNLKIEKGNTKNIFRIMGLVKDSTNKEPCEVWKMGKELIEKYWQIVCGKSVF